MSNKTVTTLLLKFDFFAITMSKDVNKYILMHHEEIALTFLKTDECRVGTSEKNYENHFLNQFNAIAGQ